MENQKLYAVIGPTASGKSEYAVSLAEKLGGEIISGDSMQVYVGMDIGTAKPTASERRGIPHHLIDVADISEAFSAVRFLKLAANAVDDICSRGKVPIIAGGTGLYIDMLLSGTTPESSECDTALRESLFAKARTEGEESLHAFLAGFDPASAAAIHPHNVKRVVRAIEIYLTTGITKTEADLRSRSGGGKYDSRVIMLSPKNRAGLYEKIERRVDGMMRKGLAYEVASLVEAGLRDTPTASQAIGYKEFYPYFDGKCSLESVADAIKQSTRRYAKRQLTWFARMQKDEIIEV